MRIREKHKISRIWNWLFHLTGGYKLPSWKRRTWAKKSISAVTIISVSENFSKVHFPWTTSVYMEGGTCKQNLHNPPNMFSLNTFLHHPRLSRLFMFMTSSTTASPWIASPFIEYPRFGLNPKPKTRQKWEKETVKVGVAKNCKLASKLGCHGADAAVPLSSHCYVEQLQSACFASF